MTDLVSTAEATEHLRRDTDDGDTDDLELKITAASQAVMQYLGWETVPDNVPEIVKAATLNLIGEMYRERDGEMSGQNSYGYGYLPLGVIALLYPLRTPSTA